MAAACKVGIVAVVCHFRMAAAVCKFVTATCTLGIVAVACKLMTVAAACKLGIVLYRLQVRDRDCNLQVWKSPICLVKIQFCMRQYSK